MRCIALLRRERLVAPRRRRAHATPSVHPLTDGVEPNDVWCADFKGWWRTADGARCEPLTISDHSTRFLLRCHAPLSTRGEDVQPLFAATFSQFGLPRVIRTDNGAPFGSVGLLGLSRLSVWLMRLGIVPERIEPAHPEQNGRHERLHKTLKDQLAASGPPRRVQRHLRDAQRDLTAFMREYNDERPHEALDNQTPGQLYTRSPRPLPRRLPEPQYGEHSHKRTVQPKGEIKWHNNVIYLGAALAEQVVALEWIDDAWLKICFMQLELARYHAPSGRLCYADGRTGQRSTRSGRPGRLVNRNQV